jgi:hypothetical protein
VAGEADDRRGARLGRSHPVGLTLDSGALIAFEARDRRVNALLQRARELDRRVVVTSDPNDIRRLDPTLQIVVV